MAETAQNQTAKMGEWADAAEKQTLIVGRQTDIQSKQHAVARLQFFATHRPEIAIHAIEFLRILGGKGGDRIGAIDPLFQ
jgi:hypothetical protein